MKRALNAAAVNAVLVVILALVGCGAGSSNGSAGTCEDGETGYRIVPRNSGLSCADGLRFLFVLGAETKRQTVNAATGKWLCRTEPPARYPLKYQCQQGAKSFDIVATRPSE
jgi:hypothetical protein